MTGYTAEFVQIYPVDDAGSGFIHFGLHLYAVIGTAAVSMALHRPDTVIVGYGKVVDAYICV